MTNTMTHLLRSAALLTGLAMLPGCPLVDVEAEVPEVCLTYPNLQVETPAQSSVTQSFVFDDLSKVHDLVKQDASLSFVRAELRVTSGLDNLDFIQAVKVMVSSGDPGTSLPSLTMYDCDGDCAPDGKALELTAGPAHNAIDYLKEDSIKIDIDFRGQIPAASWTMDIDVCIKGTASHSVSL
jgi:hypothetical protein